MSPEPRMAGHPQAPRQRLPGWVWGLGACACLPVIGVLVLGLALTPVLKRMRDMRREISRTTVCLSNVKQLASGMQMYAQDYDDRYPPSSSWTEGVVPYTQNGGDKSSTVLQCPTVHTDNPSAFGYAFNSKLASRPQSKISTPAMTPMVYDSSNLAKNASDPVTSLPHPGRHRPRRFRQPNSARINIMSYADGHAKAVTEQGHAIPTSNSSNGTDPNGADSN